MYRFIIYIAAVCVAFVTLNANNGDATAGNVTQDCDLAYVGMGLEGLIDYEAFRQATMGFKYIQAEHNNILGIIDYTKPSTEERFYIIDMEKGALLHVSHVAHGRNSGGNYATDFSNVTGSYKSSLGFFIAADRYNGRNGLSLRLNGLEQGINDKAWDRAIVIHGADYCDPVAAMIQGRLGRSLGCPAVPLANNKKIIETLEGGALLFVYAGNANYQKTSPVLAYARSEQEKVRMASAT